MIKLMHNPLFHFTGIIVVRLINNNNNRNERKKNILITVHKVPF